MSGSTFILGFCTDGAISGIGTKACALDIGDKNTKAEINKGIMYLTLIIFIP